MWAAAIEFSKDWIERGLIGSIHRRCKRRSTGTAAPARPNGPSGLQDPRTRVSGVVQHVYGVTGSGSCFGYA